MERRFVQAIQLCRSWTTDRRRCPASFAQSPRRVSSDFLRHGVSRRHRCSRGRALTEDSPRCQQTDSWRVLSGTSTPCLSLNNILLERCKTLSMSNVRRHLTMLSSYGSFFAIIRFSHPSRAYFQHPQNQLDPTRHTTNALKRHTRQEVTAR